VGNPEANSPTWREGLAKLLLPEGCQNYLDTLPILEPKRVQESSRVSHGDAFIELETPRISNAG